MLLSLINDLQPHTDVTPHWGNSWAGSWGVSWGGFQPTPPPTPGFGSGGGSSYIWAYEPKLEKKRQQTPHSTFVREAAIEALMSNYYGSKRELNELALKKLKIIAGDLEFQISKIDLELLKLEMANIRFVQEMDDEESISMFM